VCAFVYSSVLLIDANGKVISSKPYGVNKDPTNNTLERLLFVPLVYGVCSNILIKRKHIEEIGGFDELIQYGEDWDLLLRLARFGEFVFISKPLCYCRVHNQNQTSLPSVERINRILFDHLTIIEKRRIPHPTYR